MLHITCCSVTYLLVVATVLYSVSQKIPLGFYYGFPKRLEIFSPNFTRACGGDNWERMWVKRRPGPQFTRPQVRILPVDYGTHTVLVRQSSETSKYRC